jgi:mono/diheme cytochrome c family protein
MPDYMNRTPILILPALLAACQIAPAENPAPLTYGSGVFERDTAEYRGQKFARNRCSDCHAVEPLQLSPNPSAPSFVDVANTPGLSRESLASWLKTTHDFPSEMYFEIPEEHIDDLVAYMLTLQTADYEPAI